MSGFPQPTPMLIKRLRRVAKWIDESAADLRDDEMRAAAAARANTCWQAAARLEALYSGVPESPE